MPAARHQAGNVLQRLSGALLLAIWLLVVLHILTSAAFLRSLATACLALFMLCAVPRASMHIRLLFMVTVAGATWSILAHANADAVLRGLEAGLVIGAFMPTIMLLRATANASPMLDVARQRIERWSGPQREVWVQAVSHLLGSFLMVGGYAIARSALPERIDAATREQLAQGAVRGLGLAVCWSPFFLAGAIASQIVHGVSAWQLIALGLVFASLGWTLSYFLFFRALGWGEIAVPARSVAGFAVPSAALAALVILMCLVTGLKSLEAIVLALPVVCLAYLAGRGWKATREAVAPLRSALFHASDEVLIFTMAMCLGAVAAASGAGKLLSPLLAGLAGTPLLLIAAEVALIAGAGIAGVHPIITATLMLPVLAEPNRMLAALVVAYMVVFGWTLSSLLAIWTLPVASAATCFEVPVGRLARGRNVRFVIWFGACGCLLLAGLNGVLMASG